MRPTMNTRPFTPLRRMGLLAVSMIVLIPMGCKTERSGESISAEPRPKASDPIEWYEGSIEEAFDHARTAGKPLFLYWGAEWCPPCHYLKNKIFSRPEFVAQMKGYVPIYLDGDTERAQVLGEELDVQGYPTVIIFSPTGEEVMRMSSSVPVDQYAAVLDNAVSETRPAREVLAEVLDRGPSAASAADLNMLANHSWSQASQLDLSSEELLQAFKKLYEETPESQPIAKSRFLAFYIQGLAREQQDEDPSNRGSLDTGCRVALISPVVELLADPELRNSNIVFASYGARGKVDLLAPEGSSEREFLLEAWLKAAQAIETDESLTVDDRLGGTLALVDLSTTNSESSSSEDAVSVPAAIQQHARDQIAWARATVHDKSELQSVVNIMAYVLETADLEEEAEVLLIETMNDTTAPYYFMAWIADLKEQAGESDAAVDWYRKAYDSSRGAYSRFRYGSTYLRKLMELRPQGSEAVETDSLEILGELLAHSDAFAGGNYSRLDGLESAYRNWNEGPRQEAAIDKIRDFVLASCDRYLEPSGDGQHERCISFLSAEPPGEVMM